MHQLDVNLDVKIVINLDNELAVRLANNLGVKLDVKLVVKLGTRLGLKLAHDLVTLLLNLDLGVKAGADFVPIFCVIHMNLLALVVVGDHLLHGVDFLLDNVLFFCPGSSCTSSSRHPS